MPENIIRSTERGAVEVIETDGEKRIRRTIGYECPLYDTLKSAPLPYIPEIYSVVAANGQTVIEEEYIDGKNLVSANLSEKQTVDIMVQLCSTLSEIHSKGLLCR